MLSNRIIFVALVTAAVGWTNGLAESRQAMSPPTGQDPGFPDTVYIDSASALSPAQGIVPVRFFNDETLSALEITLEHDGASLTIDSFSFAGGRGASYLVKDGIVDSNVVTIFILALTEEPIPPGFGLLGNLYVSFPNTTPPQMITFDTTTVTLDVLERSTSFSSASGVSFIPQIAGEATLRIRDNCCLGLAGNIDNDPNDITDIADLTFLIDNLFIGFTPLGCPPEGNIDGDPLETVDVTDLTFLIDHLFINFTPPARCRE